MLAAVASASVAAVASPSIAAELDHGDREMRRLWAEYLAASESVKRAESFYAPARDAYDEEWKALGVEGTKEDGPAHVRLWEKYNVQPGHDALEAAWASQRKAVEAIRAAKAETAFAIGVKLCALMTGIAFAESFEEEEYQDAVLSVLPDIDRLSGGTFMESDAVTTVFQGIELAEDDDEGEDDQEAAA